MSVVGDAISVGAPTCSASAAATFAITWLIASATDDSSMSLRSPSASPASTPIIVLATARAWSGGRTNRYSPFTPPESLTATHTQRERQLAPRRGGRVPHVDAVERALGVEQLAEHLGTGRGGQLGRPADGVDLAHGATSEPSPIASRAVSSDILDARHAVVHLHGQLAPVAARASPCRSACRPRRA